MALFKSVPSDPRQAVAFYSGTAARRPAAADLDAPLVYQATDTGEISLGTGGTWATLQDQSVTGGPFLTTKWHAPAVTVTATATVASTLYAVPYKVPPGATTITGLAVQCTTLAGGSVVRLGAFARAADGTVGARLLDAGTVATTSTGVKTITSLTLAVPATRRLWLVCAAQGGSPSLNFAPVNEVMPAAAADNALAGTNAPNATGVTGAFGTTFTVAAWTNLAPHIAVQLA